MTVKNEVFTYCKEKYGVCPETPWPRFPEYAVLRHRDQKKWFALFMNVDREKLGIPGKGNVDIVNVKLSDPLLADLLTRQSGYLRGYHIMRGNWISILLDGTVAYPAICQWLDESFLATASAATRQKYRHCKEWIIPANPAYYDIIHAFDRQEEIAWKQGRGIRTGDTVYMYVAAPVSAVMYRCRVMETDIPYTQKHSNIRIPNLMRIRLEKRYDEERFSFAVLKETYGIRAVRGPRGIPDQLSRDLRKEETT